MRGCLLQPAGLALGLLLVAALVLAGCRATRVVEIEREAPPPSVVTETDTLFLASPPDTLFLAPESVRVVETRPVEVIRYLEPRPDTARATLVWRLSVDSSSVLVSLRQEDLRLRAPVPGEWLTCVSQGPEAFACRVEGEPVKPPPLRIECPEPPRPLLERSLAGYAALVIVALAGVLSGIGLSFLIRLG